MIEVAEPYTIEEARIIINARLKKEREDHKKFLKLSRDEQTEKLREAVNRISFNFTWKEEDKPISAKVNYVKNFRNKYPMKAEAHRLTRNAINRGELTKQPCEICKSEKDIHAHHDDYSKPLNVRWLCRAHHIDWHRHNEAKYDPTWEKGAV